MLSCIPDASYTSVINVTRLSADMMSCFLSTLTGVQVTPEMLDQDISEESGETMVSSLARSATSASPRAYHGSFMTESASSSLSSDADSSSDYEPPTSPSSLSDLSDEISQPCTRPDSETGTQQSRLHTEAKYIVFQSSLEMLVGWCACPECGSHEVTPKWSRSGTQLTISLFCKACDNTSRWQSQPTLGDVAAGNILLSAAILFAGASAAKVLRVLGSIGVATHTLRSFFRHQKLILHPAIDLVWKNQQTEHMTLLQVMGLPLVLGGDGRADSPGHSAKFGLYTTMDLLNNIVLDLQIVQVMNTYKPSTLLQPLLCLKLLGE